MCSNNFIVASPRQSASPIDLERFLSCFSAATRFPGILKCTHVMKVNPLAGTPAPPSMLVNVARLVTAYYAEHPDGSVVAERVAFGTSGHRGSAFERTFNEAHILAITQAICEYRKTNAIDGPLFLGFDTHAISKPPFSS